MRRTGLAVVLVARLPGVEQAVVVARAGQVAQVAVRVRRGEHPLQRAARRGQLVLRLQQVPHVVRRQRRQDVAQVLRASAGTRLLIPRTYTCVRMRGSTSVWACVYTTNTFVRALAYVPVFDPMHSM